MFCYVEFVCSNVVISTFRLLLKTPSALEAIKENKIISGPSEGLPTLLFRILIEKKDLKNYEIDTFYYFLMKKGENYLTSKLNNFTAETVKALISNLQEKRIHTVLVEIFGAEPKSEGRQAGQFVNPFAF